VKGKAAPTGSTPPADLGLTGRELWLRLVNAYKVDDEHGQTVLALACRAADREQACRKRIEKDGVAVTDKWGQTKPHPLLAAERDARAQVLAALRALSLPIPEV
jgi:P27 family predicted phage terminase small subunit